MLKQKLALAARILWASPASAIGLVLSVAVLVVGGRSRWVDGALESTYRPSVATCGRFATWLPFRGIVFGHVVLAVTAEELANISAHERVHVQQYERWGPFFLPAYAISSLWQLALGRSAYWHNHFEVEARRLSRELSRG